MDERTTQLSDRTGFQDFETADPETLQAWMAQTRAEMGETLDALQTKLAPERMAHDTQKKIKEATRRKVEEITHTATHQANKLRTGATETVKEYPLFVALAGIALVGLLVFFGWRKWR